MAAPLLAQDVTEHLQAAIQLSNRHIQVRLWDEAERFFPLSSRAAIAVAGVVLESLLAGQRHHEDPSEAPQIEKRSQLRNMAVHSHEEILSLDDARNGGGVRRLLLAAAILGPSPALTTKLERTTRASSGQV